MAKKGKYKSPIEIQISARIMVPKGHGDAITGDLLRAAVAYRLAHGTDPEGIQLQIVSWSRGEKGGSFAHVPQEKLWNDLSPMLRARFSLDASTVGASRNNG